MDRPDEKLAEKIRLVVNSGDVSKRGDVPKPGGPRVDDLIGKTIGGEYEIISLLGTGGMSAVFKARHKALDRIMAVKFILPDHAGDENSIKRFRQEAKAAIALSHQNIVKVVGFGIDEDGELPFLAMEYIEGLSLGELLKSGETFTAERSLNIAKQVCAALEEAHAHNVVHRDIKPGNIIITKNAAGDEVVKVVDFGIAKIVDEDTAQKLTQTGDMLGSPLYMSPEQCMGLPLDARSDIYSLGCVLYEMLSGAPPHRGDNTLQTIHRHVHVATEPVKQLSAALNVLLETALQKEPDKRFQTAAEFSKALANPTAFAEQSAHSAVGKPTSGTTRAGSGKPAHLFGGGRKSGILAASLIVIMVLGIFGTFYAQTILWPSPRLFKQQSNSWTWHYIKPGGTSHGGIPAKAAEYLKATSTSTGSVNLQDYERNLTRFGDAVRSIPDDKYYNSRETSITYETYKMAADILREIPQGVADVPEVTAEIHDLRSVCAVGMRDFTTGRDECTQALKDWDEAGKSFSSRYLDTVMRQANCYFMERDFTLAKERYRVVVSAWDQFIPKHDVRRAFIYSRLGDCARLTGDFKSAKNYYALAQPLWLAAGDKGAQDAAINLLLLNHMDGLIRRPMSKEYIRSEESFKQTLPAIEEAFRNSQYEKEVMLDYAQLLQNDGDANGASALRWKYLFGDGSSGSGSSSSSDGTSGSVRKKRDMSDLPIYKNEVEKPDSN